MAYLLWNLSLLPLERDAFLFEPTLVALWFLSVLQEFIYMRAQCILIIFILTCTHNSSWICPTKTSIPPTSYPFLKRKTVVHWAQFSLSAYAWVWGQSLEQGWWEQGPHPWRKLTFHFPLSQTIASQPGACEPVPCPRWNGAWLNLMLLLSRKPQLAWVAPCI